VPDPAAEGHRARGLSAAAEPTLPELVRAGWRRSGRGARTAGVLAGVILVGVAAALLLTGRGQSFAYEGGHGPRFSTSWSELDRVEGREDGTTLALESREGGQLVQALTISPIELDLEPGQEPLPRLGLDAERAREGIESEHPGARVVLEGRTLLAVDRGPEAYQLAFAAPADDGAILIGKRLLVPDPVRPGEGLEIEILERTSKQAVIEKVERAPAGFFGNWPIQLLLEDAASVRTEEGLEEPLRSFAFG
jgi:hypothetical protein